MREEGLERKGAAQPQIHPTHAHRDLRGDLQQSQPQGADVACGKLGAGKAPRPQPIEEQVAEGAQPQAQQTPSLPDARPRSDRLRCESNFLQSVPLTAKSSRHDLSFTFLAKNNDGGLEAGVTRGLSSAVYAVEAGVLMLGV